MQASNSSDSSSVLLPQYFYHVDLTINYAVLNSPNSHFNAEQRILLKENPQRQCLVYSVDVRNNSALVYFTTSDPHPGSKPGGHIPVFPTHGHRDEAQPPIIPSPVGQTAGFLNISHRFRIAVQRVEMLDGGAQPGATDSPIHLRLPDDDFDRVRKLYEQSAESPDVGTAEDSTPVEGVFKPLLSTWGGGPNSQVLGELGAVISST